MGKINHMNTGTDQELLFGHSLLHKWRRNNWREKPKNWTKSQVRKEHSRLVKIMEGRGFEHNTPIN